MSGLYGSTSSAGQQAGTGSEPVTTDAAISGSGSNKYPQQDSSQDNKQTYDHSNNGCSDSPPVQQSAGIMDLFKLV